LRAEDKEVDGRELEREQRLAESELDKGVDEELPEVVADELRVLAPTERGALVAAMREILAGNDIVIDTLHLPAHELHALEALQAAVEGRDGMHAFVYAEDRSSLLEQALAVLQPNLAYDDETYGELVARVGELRRGLSNLAEAQEEMGGEGEHAELAKKPPESSVPGPDVDPDAPKPPSTLSAGLEIKEPPKPATSLAGPELKDAAKPASTLSAGPEVKEDAAAATSLGDATEIAAAQADETPKVKKPWWKRVLS
jgi:hypothetical protein